MLTAPESDADYWGHGQTGNGVTVDAQRATDWVSPRNHPLDAENPPIVLSASQRRNDWLRPPGQYTSPVTGTRGRMGRS